MVRIICAAVLLLTLACGAFAQEPVASVATTTSGAVASTTTSGAVASTTTSGPVASITTSDGQTFNNVTVLKVKGDKVLLTCSEGGALVALDTLSDETRKALGLRTRDEQAAFESRIRGRADEKRTCEVGDDWVTPKEKERRDADAKQAAFEAEQVKKGLVKSGTDWVTPEEKERRDAKQAAFEAEQAKKGLVKLGADWVTPEQAHHALLKERMRLADAIKSAVHDYNVAEDVVNSRIRIRMYEGQSTLDREAIRAAEMDQIGMRGGEEMAELGDKAALERFIRENKNMQIKKVTRGSLGVQMLEGSDFAQVISDSPAQKPDLKKGDIITKVAGHAVRTQLAGEDVLDTVASMSPGDTVSIEIVRDGKAQTIKVVLGERPAAAIEGFQEHLERLCAAKHHAQEATAALDAFDHDHIGIAQELGYKPGEWK